MLKEKNATCYGLDLKCPSNIKYIWRQGCGSWMHYIIEWINPLMNSQLNALLGSRGWRRDSVGITWMGVFLSSASLFSLSASWQQHHFSLVASQHRLYSLQQWVRINLSSFKLRVWGILSPWQKGANTEVAPRNGFIAVIITNFQKKVYKSIKMCDSDTGTPWVQMLQAASMKNKAQWRLWDVGDTTYVEYQLKKAAGTQQSLKVYRSLQVDLLLQPETRAIKAAASKAFMDSAGTKPFGVCISA